MSLPGFGELTRRRFLQAGTAAVLTLGGEPAGLRAAAPTDPFGGFLLGIQSYSFRNFNTEQALTRTRELGLHYVEFFQVHAPLTLNPEQVKEVRKLCAGNGITAIAYGVQGFTKDHQANRKIFDFGKALGIKTFTADPDPDSFDSLDKLVEESKIAVAIHNHGPVGGGRLHRWYSAEIILDAVKNHHARIGSCLDTGHLIRSAQLGKHLDPATQIRVMGPRNLALHLKDHDIKKNTDVVFGQGALDTPGVLKALREVKFQGHLSIEYEAHPEDPSPDMKACVAVFRQAVQQLG